MIRIAIIDTPASTSLNHYIASRYLASCDFLLALTDILLLILAVGVLVLLI